MITVAEFIRYIAIQFSAFAHRSYTAVGVIWVRGSFIKFGLILTVIILLIETDYGVYSVSKSGYVSEAALRAKGVHIERQRYSLSFSVRYGSRRYYFYDGSRYYVYKNKIYTMPEAAMIRGNEIWLPKDFVSRVLKVSAKKHAIPVPDDSKKNTGSQLDFIVIDPGHGGRDPGTLNSRYKEKHITLKAGRYLFQYLKKRFKNTRIYITRYNDRYLSLEERAQISNRKNAPGKFGIFISIHCNASFVSSARGFEVYYLDQNPSNEESREVMLRENGFAEGRKYVKKLESVLINTQIQAESKMLARQINRSLLASMKGLAKGRGVRKADFAVLRGALMPSVLIEMGYLSNPAEARLMNQTRYYQQLARGIELGIKRFIQKRPKI